jgi:hypothetical protein
MYMQQELNNDFIAAILEKYHAATPEPTDVSLLEYLIERKIIPKQVISKYMILELYPHELQRCPTREAAICVISEHTGFSCSHIRHTIEDPRQFQTVRLKRQK